MIARLALVACLLLATAALAAPAVAQEDADAAELDNVTVGQEISAFMQTAEASAEGEVSDGMFEARVEATNESEREEVITERTTALEDRVAAIEARIDRLRENRNDTNPVAYRAQMSAAAAQLASVQRSANRTADAAAGAGVDTSRLETLRANASEMAGQEVAAIARGLAGVVSAGPPDHAGPPDDAGPPGGDGPPGGQGPGGNETGPPDDAGPPDDTGQSSGGAGNEGAGTGGQGNEGTGTGGQGNEGTGTGGQGNEGTGTGGQGNDGAGTGGQGNEGTGAGVGGARTVVLP